MNHLAIVLLLGASAAWAQSASDNLALRWNSAALEAVRNTKMGPPMTARALALTHTAIYDAWAAYDDQAVGTKLGSTLRRPPAERTAENRAEAISYAAYDVLLDLFPTQGEVFRAVLASGGYSSLETSLEVSRAAGVGRVAARAVLEASRRDGSNQQNGYADTTGYQPTNAPGQIVDANRWEPLAVPDGKGGTVTQKFLVPHWGTVTPFAMRSGDQFRPLVQLPAVGSREYTSQVRELLSYSALLSDYQKSLAEYWADGPASVTPPGHWNLFAQEVSRRDGHTLDEDVKMFFAVTNALFDASIAAWDAKRTYEYVRPVTAVRYLYQGKMVQAWGGPNAGAMRIDGANWQPYQAATFVTPAFPEYVSGHSTFSAAAAEVLKSFTGSDLFGTSATIKAGSSVFEPGRVPAADVTLTWSTFTEAADEAGMSRRYGGIHFPQGDLDGRTLGRQVGAHAWKKVVALVRGDGE